jgi:hypothetical protein
MKKRKKIVFSIYNYFEPISSEVVKIQTQFKALSGTLLVSSYVTQSEQITMILTASLFVINELISCISFEEDEQIS